MEGFWVEAGACEVEAMDEWVGVEWVGVEGVGERV